MNNKKYLEAIGIEGKTRMLIKMENYRITLGTPKSDEDLEEEEGGRIVT